MISKIFRGISVFLIRVAGIAACIISVRLLYDSINILSNLYQVLSFNGQVDVSFGRLLFLFFANFLSLIFDWAIAMTIFVIGISGCLYKTRIADEIANVDCI